MPHEFLDQKGSALRPSLLTNGSPLNWYDFTSNRGLSDFNVGRRFVVSTLYELPFGRGKSFGAKWNPLLDKIAGGWQVGSILAFADGTPIDVGALAIPRIRKKVSFRMRPASARSRASRLHRDSGTSRPLTQRTRS